MKVYITSDDNAGFTPNEAKELNIAIIPMPIIIDGAPYYQHKTLDEKTFYEKLIAGSNVSTSQPLPQDLISVWDNKLKEYDQIVHIPMSSGLSNSCQMAKMLAETPPYVGKVFVVDNHRISVTLKSSVYDAIALAKQGLSGEEIKNKLEEDGFNSEIYIMVDTLKFLKKGGRVTPAAAAFAGALNIKPILKIEGEKLDAFKKVIGTKKAKLAMIEAIENNLNNKFKDVPREELAFAIAYTYDIEEANIFKKQVLDHFGVKDVLMNPLSLSIATHIGPGALAITVTHVFDKNLSLDNYQE